MNKLFKEVYKNALKSNNISFLKDTIFIQPRKYFKFYANLSKKWYWYEDDDYITYLRSEFYRSLNYDWTIK